MTENLTPKPCTTWTRQKRHYADRIVAAAGGRVGLTFCGRLGVDQVRADELFPAAPVVIADLPVCKLCARKTGGAS